MIQSSFVIAVVLSLLVNISLPPLVTLSNQLVAILGWGALLLMARSRLPSPRIAAATFGVWSAIALIGLLCALSFSASHLSASATLRTEALLMVTAAVMFHGAGLETATREATFRKFAIALVLAGIFNAVIAMLQIFWPGAIDDFYLSFASLAGRASANLGQPNHLADILLWAWIALVALTPNAPRHGLKDVGVVSGVALLEVGFMLGVVLTGSRTAMLSVVIIAAWGALDKALHRRHRIMFGAAPIIVALCWLCMRSGPAATGTAGGLTHGGDFSGFRFELWRNAFQLIREQPGLGVGWGRFNLAWTLTPIAYRPAGYVDNAHDLPLHLAVELGVPLAALVIALVFIALRRAVRSLRSLGGRLGIQARCATMMVAVIGVHSLFEYPLWYSYLILPAAWALGFVLGADQGQGSAIDAPQPPGRGLAGPAWIHVAGWRLMGAALVVGAVFSWIDYTEVITINFPPDEDRPLAERLDRAEASPLFADEADRFLALQGSPTPAALPVIERAARGLLTGRLMVRWAQTLHAEGEEDKARFVAARLREFGPRENDGPFFAPCRDATLSDKPFQCLPPTRPLTWRDFR